MIAASIVFRDRLLQAAATLDDAMARIGPLVQDRLGLAAAAEEAQTWRARMDENLARRVATARQRLNEPAALPFSPVALSQELLQAQLRVERANQAAAAARNRVGCPLTRLKHCSRC